MLTLSPPELYCGLAAADVKAIFTIPGASTDADEFCTAYRRGYGFAFLG